MRRRIPRPSDIANHTQRLTQRVIDQSEHYADGDCRHECHYTTNPERIRTKR